MTSITSDQNLSAMSPAPKSRVNWGRIGFLSLNVAAWAGIIIAARMFL